MKLKEISVWPTEKEYRAVNQISYSLLSKTDEIGSAIGSNEWDGNKGTDMGQCIEDMLFGVHNPDDYLVDDITEPGETLKVAVDQVMSILGIVDLKLPDDVERLKKMFSVVLENNPEIEYYKNQKPDSRVEKMFSLEKNGAYFYIAYLVRGQNKILFSPEQYETCEKCADALKTHAFTKHIWEIEDHQEGMQQFKGEFDFSKHLPTGPKGVLIKYMVDWLKIDHRRKEISPYDIKTGAFSAFTFEFTYYKRRYDIQDFIYSLGVKEYLKDFFPDYHVNPLTFVYISTTDSLYRPLKWEGLGPHNILNDGYYRGTKRYKGVTELIEEYLFYSSTNFTIPYPPNVHKRNGSMKINENMLVNRKPDRTYA